MKKLFVSLLCAVMLVTFMPSMAFAETLANDTAVISIHSEDELKKIGIETDYPLDGNYVLADDITLSNENWMPIGPGIRAGSGFTTASKPFTGTFDGKGHTISGMKVSIAESQNTDYALGLFGIVSGGTVKNFNLENVSIIAPGNEMAGGAIGMLTNGGTAENITVDGEISVKRGNGGIVGRMTKFGIITGCENNATINGTGANVGGIVGAAYYTITDGEMYISDCENNGAVAGTEGAVGGIVGLSAAHISNCKNTAAVSGNGADIAGIAAEQQNYGSIKNCTNTGTITNTSDKYGTGGIVGWVRYNGLIDNYQQKDIIEVKDNLNIASISGGNDAGGIVGTVYNAVVVTGNENHAEKLNGKTFAAGIVGNLQFTESPVGNIPTKDIQIKNNISGTAFENITGDCKSLYVYNNHTTSDSSIIIQDNATAWLAQVGAEKYASLQMAIDLASPGQTVRVLRDINLSSQLTVNKKLVLDLNGKTLSNSTVIWNDDQKHWSYISVKNGGVLTITGNGVMQTKENDCYAIDLRGGSCNVENGTFIGNVHAVYIHDGALNVYGGNFSVQQKYSAAQPDQFVLNCLDKNYKNGTAKITVYGGTYAGFNPGNCEAEGKGTNFLASGYEVKENGDSTFTVEKTEVPPYIPPVNPPASDNVTNDTDDKTTNADIDATINADGKAEATVDQTTADKIVDKAVANGSTEIIIDATTSAGKADAAEVKLPAETVVQLVEKTDADIIVKTDAAEVKLDQEAAKAITETASTGTVSIIVEKTKDESAEMRFELRMMTENGAVADFKGGTVAVSVKLNDTLKDKEVACVYVDENGRYYKVRGEKDALKGVYTFFADCPETFVIMEEAAADQIIEEQTNARLKAGVENTTIKLYYNKKEIGKGWIKLRYKKSYGYKVDNYEIFRSAKKKTNFGDEAWFVTKTNKTKGFYKNGKSVKKGTRYYYKMRGVREIAGETVYTQWSNIVMRTGR